MPVVVGQKYSKWLRGKESIMVVKHIFMFQKNTGRWKKGRWYAKCESSSHPGRHAIISLNTLTAGDRYTLLVPFGVRA